jgi:hypothetical protein
MNPWKLSTFVFASLFAATLATQTFQSADAERQPHMRAALSSLQSAKAQLEKASSDKGGHRVKALALTKQAIEQVEKGIAFDNRN